MKKILSKKKYKNLSHNQQMMRKKNRKRHKNKKMNSNLRMNLSLLKILKSQRKSNNLILIHNKTKKMKIKQKLLN